jgi:hypothetical protein
MSVDLLGAFRDASRLRSRWPKLPGSLKSFPIPLRPLANANDPYSTPSHDASGPMWLANGDDGAATRLSQEYQP